jgi:hypothetical protein
VLRHTRRAFLKRAAATAGVTTVFTVAGTRASGRVLGANDRVRIAVAGINGRGQTHLAGFGGMKDVEIACLVDPDSRLFASRSKIVTERAGNAMFQESFESMKRHLAGTGQVELAATPCRLGRTLTFDGESERFVDAPDANQLLTQSYRDSFVVPERV